MNRIFALLFENCRMFALIKLFFGCLTYRMFARYQKVLPDFIRNFCRKLKQNCWMFCASFMTSRLIQTEVTLKHYNIKLLDSSLLGLSPLTFYVPFHHITFHQMFLLFTLFSKAQFGYELLKNFPSLAIQPFYLN